MPDSDALSLTHLFTFMLSLPWWADFNGNAVDSG